MATKEDQETLRLLVQHVSRAFYEPKYTIIMDQLARHPVLKDDELAGRMGLQPKELNKVIAVLSNDSLVKIYRQNELKEGAQRSVGKQYYYIDYEHFCNVVKWRMAKMRYIIDSTLRNELDNKGYICPQCKQSYSPLEVDKLMDFAKGALICEICHAEVMDNEDAESVQGSKDRMQRFNSQMRFIREGLQKSESMVLPAFDVAAWIKNNPSESDKKSSSLSSGLKVAGADGSRKEEEGVGVMMAMDKDELTRRIERDAEAEVKRQQNALPAWHLKSTITGDLTALGVKETAREAAAVSGGSGVNGVGGEQQMANDDILKGLGVVGGSRAQGQSMYGQLGLGGVVEDVKPTINVESDMYDQYYASLAASAATSAVPTPTGLASSSSNSPNYPTPYSSQLNDEEEEEEDKKPNVEYLDSLNAYRKRSRSQEDVGAASKIKVAKVEAGYPNGVVNGIGTPNGDGFGYTDGYGHGNGGDAYGGEGQQDAVMEVLQEASAEMAFLEDDPMVMVAGMPKPYSQVTDEDHDLMTPEEYMAYFEILQARS